MDHHSPIQNAEDFDTQPAFGRDLIYLVGFSEVQRQAISEAARLNGFDVTMAVDEASFVQDLWPTLLGYRVAAKPTLVIADEAILSEQGRQLLKELEEHVNAIVTLDSAQRCPVQWARDILPKPALWSWPPPTSRYLSWVH